VRKKASKQSRKMIHGERLRAPLSGFDALVVEVKKISLRVSHPAVHVKRSNGDHAPVGPSWQVNVSDVNASRGKGGKAQCRVLHWLDMVTVSDFCGVFIRILSYC